MIFYIKFLILLFIGSITKSQCQELDVVRTYNNNSRSSCVNNYIYLNKIQYANNIKDLETQIETFKRIYNFRLNTIEIQFDILAEGLLLNEERLNPLEVLSDLSKYCISKYRSIVPTIESTKASLQSCIATAKYEMDSMLKYPEVAKDNVQYSYNYFDSIVDGCNIEYGNLTPNYTTCISDAVYYTNTVANRDRKMFTSEMNAAYCAADTNIKNAIDCSFSIQNQTISSSAEANTLINKCLLGFDNCENNKKGYFCQYAYTISKSNINQSTMVNPFYGRNEKLDCLMMEIN